MQGPTAIIKVNTAYGKAPTVIATGPFRRPGILVVTMAFTSLLQALLTLFLPDHGHKK